MVKEFIMIIIVLFHKNIKMNTIFIKPKNRPKTMALWRIIKALYCPIKTIISRTTVTVTVLNS